MREVMAEVNELQCHDNEAIVDILGTLTLDTLSIRRSERLPDIATNLTSKLILVVSIDI